MEIFIAWILLSLLIGLVGKDRKIGYGMTVLWCVLLSPIIGLIIALLSPSKKSAQKTPPKHREMREMGEKAEFRGDYKEAHKYYMDSLYHLQNDYKNQKLTKQLEQRRQTFVEELNHKIESLKKEHLSDQT